MSPQKITASKIEQAATIATFVTVMRAESLLEYLELQSIPAAMYQPQHTNKRMPPPRIAVIVPPQHADAAKEAYERWKAY